MLEPHIAQGDGTWRSLFTGTVVQGGGGAPPTQGSPYASTVLGRLPTGTVVTGEILNEASGGCDSRLFTDTWWTHEDSGGAYIYALGYAGSPTSDDSVALLKAFQLTGVQVGAGQWEDMTYDHFSGRRKMWVANCGGNTPVSSFKAFYFDEPTSLASPGTVTDHPVTTYFFEYPDAGAWDCETMMCDPLTGRLYFLTKEPIGTAQVYAAPASLVARTGGGSEMNALTQLTTGNFTKAGNLTGGDFSPDGTAFYCANNGSRGFKYSVQRDGSNVITGFTFVEEFFIPEPVTTNNTTVTAETLFVTQDGTGLIRNSEGPGPQIIRLELV